MCKRTAPGALQDAPRGPGIASFIGGRPAHTASPWPTHPNATIAAAEAWPWRCAGALINMIIRRKPFDGLDHDLDQLLDPQNDALEPEEGRQ
jgi:hypothetical protein